MLTQSHFFDQNHTTIRSSFIFCFTSLFLRSERITNFLTKFEFFSFELLLFILSNTNIVFLIATKTFTTIFWAKMHFTNSEMTTTSRTKFHHLVIFEINEVNQQATTDGIYRNLMFEHDKHLVKIQRIGRVI